MKDVVFLKLGGSLITDKSSAYTARQDVIDMLAEQMHDAVTADPDLSLIIGNGAGSFGHYAVMEHSMKNGISKKKDLLGFAHVQKAVADLNRIIVNSLIKKGVAAVSFHPSSAVTGHDGKIISFCADALAEMMRVGLSPVMYGDIIADRVRGSMIASTEMLISASIEPLKKCHVNIKKVIHNGSVQGVLNANGDVIPQVSHKNIDVVRKSITKTEGYDVTGGMLHKLEESLQLADIGIQTQIINGVSEKDLLKNALLGKRVVGTTIS